MGQLEEGGSSARGESWRRLAARLDLVLVSTDRLLRFLVALTPTPGRRRKGRIKVVG
jgi:hypothetical protein